MELMVQKIHAFFIVHIWTFNLAFKSFQLGSSLYERIYVTNCIVTFSSFATIGYRELYPDSYLVSPHKIDDRLLVGNWIIRGYTSFYFAPR